MKREVSPGASESTRSSVFKSSLTNPAPETIVKPDNVPVPGFPLKVMPASTGSTSLTIVLPVF